jgi:hypothetical protein
MSVYRYIAEMNPDQANGFCESKGYYSSDLEELAMNLQQIVAENGKIALKKIMELHPDKEVIVELFQSQPISETKIEGIMEVSPQSQPIVTPIMLNADGSSNQDKITINTNAAILVAALIVSVAIISMK